jgi:hypothetical protein
MSMCVDCGCCLAVVPGQQICWECDAGEPCKGKKQRAAEMLAAPRPEVPIAPPASLVAPKSEPKSEVRKESTKMTREVKPGAVPCAAAGCTLNAYPPRKYCTTLHAYQNARRKAEKPTDAKAEKPAQRTAVPAPRAAVSISPADTPFKVSISAEITEAGANAWWTSLTLEQKAKSIELMMLAILDRASEAA